MRLPAYGASAFDPRTLSIPAGLEVSIGQHSARGRNEVNQGSYGAMLPNEPLRGTKGIAIAIADGVSSSELGRVAAHTCITAFLEDYFCTPESWSVRTSVEKVLSGLNCWLHAQGRGHSRGRGLISTLSALVVKSTTAHLFHIGDTRIYLVRGEAIEQLTTDHRIWGSAEEGLVLSRAMGADGHLNVDYLQLPLSEGDLFLLTSDGVHDSLDNKALAELATQQNVETLDARAQAICDAALERGSRGNLTCQLLRVVSLPVQDLDELRQQLTALPLPPPLAPGMVLDGYRVLRELHLSKRTHVFLALDLQTDTRVVLKVPATGHQDDAAYMERALLEEWVAQRIDSPHVLKFYGQGRRTSLYLVTEYLEGQSLRQWMHDHPERSLEQVRDILRQVGNGLQAFHSMELVHQDLQPENLVIDRTGTVKIVDFGSAEVAGIAESQSPVKRAHALGATVYTAPEYLFQQAGSTRSDLYSLGVIGYELCTGELPYRDRLGVAHSALGPNAKDYIPARERNTSIPTWVDGALRKAVHPDPRCRYVSVTELLYDLSHPNPALTDPKRRPFIVRDPVGFWRGIAVLLLILNLVWLYLFLR